MNAVDRLLAHIEQRRRECESAMRDHMGGGTMCQVHKDGRVSGGLKYEEGRLVAFGNVRRALKRLSPTADESPALAEILTSEAAAWQAQLTRHQSAAKPAMMWLAYSQGGADAVAQMQRELPNILSPDSV